MFADPIKNLKKFGLREDMIVADLGAGTGFYSIPLARIVTKGKVYAVEIQADYVTTLRNKIKSENLNNIEILWGNVEKLGGTKIKDEIVDAVVASNILFQVEDKQTFVREIKRIVKRGGLVLLIDWSDSSSVGLSKASLVPKEKAQAMFESEGFKSVGDIDAGAHHYGMILTKL